MSYLFIVKMDLDRPYAHWVEQFDADAPNREAGGVHCLFRHPVMGEQAVVFGMKTEDRRSVHDMMYHPDLRPHVEESGLVIGSEQILVCDASA